MPKGTITVSYDALTQMLRQVMFLPQFTVTGAWVGSEGLEVHIQGDAIKDGLAVDAGFIPATWVEPPVSEAKPGPSVKGVVPKRTKVQ